MTRQVLEQDNSGEIVKMNSQSRFPFLKTVDVLKTNQVKYISTSFFKGIQDCRVVLSEVSTNMILILKLKKNKHVIISLKMIFCFNDISNVGFTNAYGSTL